MLLMLNTIYMHRPHKMLPAMAMASNAMDYPTKQVAVEARPARA